MGRPLTPGQVKKFCELLLGGTPLPEPEVDLGAFMKVVDIELAKQPKVYDPLSKKMEPWIKRGLIEAHIGAQSGTPSQPRQRGCGCPCRSEVGGTRHSIEKRRPTLPFKVKSFPFPYPCVTLRRTPHLRAALAHI